MMPPRIATANGGTFNLKHPRAADVDIHVIAHALSNLCRYTGHCSRFYSVAEHSVMVSRLVPPQFALAALLHDATEAYVGDVSAPLKALLPEYRAIETEVARAIADKFDLSLTEECAEWIQTADRVALMTEARVLLPRMDPDDWADFADVMPCKSIPVVGYLPNDAKSRFLARYVALTGEIA